ncbi:MAG TPA: TraB/GumN family protein [Thermodesulfobacteriota bacterium]|nr:TraB/GumN family protein [Thermodesulfobacteriota bacterium]
MIRKVKRVLFVVFILFLLNSFVCLQESGSADSKSFLWKVQSETNTVYLLGSIHLFKKELYPLNEKIEEAFDRADLLAVEANIGDTRQMDLQKLIEKAIYLGDDTLEKHVSRETFELIRKRAEGLGLPLELINKQKPWFLGLMFTSVEFLKLGFDPNYGIDKHFLSKADGKKRILELESLDYQINLLSNFNDHDQELFLLLALKDANTQSQEVKELLQAWTSGDVNGLERIMTKSIEEDKRLSSVYDILINDRNKNMASKIADFLKMKETYFVIVGAGHLVGNKGIVEILKAKGYHVEQM